MNFASWGIPDFTVSGWGVTPISLVAPLALIVLMVMARRVSRTAGPKMATRDFGGAMLITVIIGAAFLWIFAGLGVLSRTFR